MRKAFVTDYTIQNIINMTKDEYVVGLGRKDTFCYRLETELQELGDIHGATSYKFGMYYGKSGDDLEDKYRTAKSKFGEYPDEAFEKIKKQIVFLIVAGQKNDLSGIRECKIAPMFRGKILSTYFPDKYLPIFSKAHLEYFTIKIGLSNNESEDEIDKQLKLIEWKNSQSLMKEVLQYEKVFYPKDIELMKRIYLSDNHASTCYEMAVQDEKSPSSYIKPVVSLYPELDMLASDEEEDDRLVDDLRKAVISDKGARFEYRGKPKNKQMPVYSNGRKVYPRDRKVALNALAHANHTCEIDDRIVNSHNWYLEWLAVTKKSVYYLTLKKGLPLKKDIFRISMAASIAINENFD